MAIKSLDDILRGVKTLIGGEQTDEALELLEDIVDTFSEVSKDSTQDWKKKFEENDASWRKKYRDRFFAKPDEVESEEDEDSDGEDRKILKYEELFKEE